MDPDRWLRPELQPLAGLFDPEVLFSPVQSRIGLAGIIDREYMKKSIIPDFQPYLVLAAFICFVEMIEDILFINIAAESKSPDTKPVTGNGVDTVAANE